jgi:NADPH:quinone reductase-like Zn-dependent oxidoreductase
MSDIAERLAKLSPEKRALLIQRLTGKRDDVGASASAQSTETAPARPPKEWDAFCFRTGTPGNFESIKFRPLELTPPGPEQIQIRTKAVSLNFRDLMIAMNMYPPTPGVPSIMGSDYAGEVLSCGEGVEDIKPGDEVMALSAGHFTPEGALVEESHFCSVFNVSSRQAVRKAENISFTEAACVPTVFLTSYYALHTVARLRRGERVLIHTATGGVGLAALQIARWLGAEVFATAGSEEKRALLRSLGVEHALDSRTTEFAARIMELTRGEGVDVILNTLAGEAAPKGLETLRAFGRFLQIDKQDIARGAALDLTPFKRGLSFSAIDLSLFLMQPDRLKELLLEINEHLRAEHFRPVPFTAYPVERLGAALTFMSRAKHTGKLVLTYE